MTNFKPVYGSNPHRAVTFKQPSFSESLHDYCRRHGVDPRMPTTASYLAAHKAWSEGLDALWRLWTKEDLAVLNDYTNKRVSWY